MHRKTTEEKNREKELDQKRRVFEKSARVMLDEGNTEKQQGAAEFFTNFETDDDILPYLFKAYKCVPQSNISLSFANTGDPGTITITCDLLVDDDGNMLDLTLLPEEGE